MESTCDIILYLQYLYLHVQYSGTRASLQPEFKKKNLKSEAAKNVWRCCMGIKPEAFPMRKGRSTSELHLQLSNVNVNTNLSAAFFF